MAGDRRLTDDERRALTDDERLAIERDVFNRFGACPGGANGIREWLGLSVSRRHKPLAVYDLTTAEFDQPHTPAVRSLVLCGTYRSGSSLVAEALQAAGGYGIPLEYFQEGASERRYRRWLVGSSSYRDQVIAARTDPTGVFGVKLFWPDLANLTGMASMAPETATVAIAGVLPRPLFVWIRRRDTVAQAVSTLRALHSDRWRSLAAEGSTPAPASRSSGPADAAGYDFDRLYRLVGMLLRHDSLWASCFSTSQAPRVAVWYEDIAVDPARTLSELTERLADRGMPPRANAPYPIRLHKQAPASADQQALRFLRELRDNHNG